MSRISAGTPTAASSDPARAVPGRAACSAGLLVAGLTLPLVGGLGLAARDSADGFDSLPAELEIPPLPERSRILAADGSLIASSSTENRVSVPLSEVAPVMRTGRHRDRGLPLLRARRHRPPRHAARLRQQPVRRGRAGRVDADPAVRQAGAARAGAEHQGRQGARGRDQGRHGAVVQPQAARAALRGGARGEVHQGADPRALPQHRLLRRRRLRRRGRGQALLQHARRAT